MKKIIIVYVAIFAAIVVLYFILAAALTAGGKCPKYINLMPGITGPGFPERHNPQWYIFCPFSEKVY